MSPRENRSGPHPQVGFTLVELLVATTLGSWLMASLGVAASGLWGSSHAAAQQSDAIERVDFALRHFTESIWAAWPVGSATGALSPCLPPDAGLGAGIRIVERGEYECLPMTDLITGMPLLVVESRIACQDRKCTAAALPGWRLESPGCHPVFESVPISLVYRRTRLQSGDCAGAVDQSLWSRRLYYLRRHAWQRGDGIGALMMKQWGGPGEGFGRAEMLVPGVQDWSVMPIGVAGEVDSRVVGINITLVGGPVFSGHVKHAEATGLGGLPVNSPPGLGVPGEMRVTSRLVSRFLSLAKSGDGRAEEADTQPW